MPTLVELTDQHTSLSSDEVDHLVALVSEWGMLADFSFADLLLYVPVASDGGINWLTASQVRAATGQTLYQSDLVGEYADDTDRPFIAAAAQSGQIQQGEITLPYLADPVNMSAIPVVCEGKVIAVLTREVSSVTGRRPGQLERTYLSIFDDFAAMIAAGLFPFAGRVADSSVSPRVGDGVIVLDGSARVRYASPNAVSALHRVGIRANAVGQSLAELGFAHDAARASFERREPVVEELDQDHDVTLLVRSIPILKRGGSCCERDWWGGVDARRVRVTPARPIDSHQRRHHQRNSPPSEEQPADHFVTAAPAGSAPEQRRSKSSSC